MRVPTARRAAAAVVAAALPLLGSRAAGAETTHETQQWAAVAATARLTGESNEAPGLSGWFDEHVRRAPDRTTFIVRPGLGLRLGPTVSLWAGYAWVPTLIDGEPTVHEHRVWQQGIVQGRSGRFSLQLRPRLEQRLRDGDDEVGVRVRLFGRVNTRLLDDAPLDLALWDELFVGLHDTGWGQQGGFDQNRAFIGPAWTAGPVRLELGYLQAAVHRADGSWLIAHNPSLWAFVSL